MTLFKNRTLLFSAPSVFNDPFDSCIRNEAGRDHLERHFFKYSSFILCLTRTPNNALMWSHYGDEHRGIVIGFEVDKIPELRDECVIPVDQGDIIYTKTRPSKSTDPKKNFLYKSLEWSYEEEIRIVKQAINPIDRYEEEPEPSENIEFLDPHNRRFSLRFPAEAIREIYLGCNFVRNVEIDDSDPHYGSDEYVQDTIHFVPEFMCFISKNYPEAKVKMFHSDSSSWNLEFKPDDYLDLELEGYEIYRQKGYNGYRNWLTEE